MKEKLEKIIVHVPTQEDWGYVINKLVGLGVRSYYYNKWEHYKENTYIDCRICCHADKKYFETHRYYKNHKIISVKEFKELIGDKPKFKVGDKVRVLSKSIPFSDWDDNLIGSETVVEGIEGDGLGKNTDNCIVVKSVGECCFFAPQDLELIEEPDEEKTFEPNKNAKELGIDLSRKFIVVKKTGFNPEVGDILEIKKDDNSENPYFWNLTANRAVGDKHETEDKWRCVAYWSQLAYYDESDEEKTINYQDISNKIINKEPKSSIINKTMTNAIKFVKEKALKATNPDQYELYKAGLEYENGENTGEGEELEAKLLRDLIRAEKVKIAKEMNAEEKSKK